MLTKTAGFDVSISFKNPEKLKTYPEFNPDYKEYWRLLNEKQNGIEIRAYRCQLFFDSTATDGQFLLCEADRVIGRVKFAKSFDK